MSYVLAFLAEFSCSWHRYYIAWLESKAARWEKKAKDYRQYAVKEKEFFEQDCKHKWA